MAVAISIALLVVGAVIAVVVQLMFGDLIERALAQTLWTFSGNRADRRVGGRWHSYYEVYRHDEGPPSVGEPLIDTNKGVIEFRRVGSTVIGRNVEGTRPYSIRLRVRDNSILTGTWSDNSSGRYHFGAVQFVWATDGLTMSGRFVGRDRGLRVNHGYWVLAKDESEMVPIIERYRSEE